MEKPKYVRKSQRKGFFPKKNRNGVCCHPKPVSGDSFTICFTLSKPSAIPMSRVLPEDTSDGKTKVIISYSSINLATH